MPYIPLGGKCYLAPIAGETDLDQWLAALREAGQKALKNVNRMSLSIHMINI